MKLTNQTTVTYETKNEFMVDIVDQDDGYTFAWIYHKDFGIKNGMFGLKAPMKEFLEIVENNLDEYIEDYIERFAPELNYLERR